MYQEHDFEHDKRRSRVRQSPATILLHSCMPLMEEKNQGNSTIHGAFYAIRSIHKLAALDSPTEDDFVQCIFNGVEEKRG